MAPKLYSMDISPPARAVLLTAKALGLDLELVLVNMYTREHLKPDFIKKNPQHTIPTLEDDGVYIWDSHAINAYLCDRYGKDDSLYPKDPLKRAVVNQRMFFNVGIIQERVSDIMRGIVLRGEKIIPKEKSDSLIDGYILLDKFMENHQFIAGDSLTIADLCVVAAISTIVHFVSIDQDKLPRLFGWFQRMQQLPYYAEANKVGSDKLLAFVKSKLA